MAAVVVMVVGAVGLLNQESRDDTNTALSAGPPAADSFSAGRGEAADSSEKATSSQASTATGDLGDVADVNALRQRVAVAVPTARSGSAAANVPSVATGVSPASGSGTGAPAPVQVGTRVCEEQARTARPTLGVVVYAANLRYAGTTAVVLGFAARASDPPATLVVLAPEQGCRVLVETYPS